MKYLRVLLVLLLIFVFNVLSAQDEKQEDEQNIPEKFNRLETLSNQQEDEIKVEIRKPDNVSLMNRKPTKFEIKKKFVAYEKLKKSNLMIY